MNSIIENIILGIIQGITEWLPVSSEGMIVLAKVNLFSGQGLEVPIKLALFLHLGTFFAALIYFRKDVVKILKVIPNYKNSDLERKNIFKFLFVSTLVSGVLGFLLFKTLLFFEEQIAFTGKLITLIIGLLLLGTALLQLKFKREGIKGLKDLKFVDGLILGIVQGFSILPGLSRSGLTISSLLLRKFNETHALKLSFLMSLPIVLAGNIVLNLNEMVFTFNGLIGLLFAFLFGILTIHLLLKFSRKVNFGYFVLVFGLITLGAVFVIP